MKQHLNTLFVTTPDAYLSKDGEAVVVKIQKKVAMRVPILTLGGIVCMGRIGVSPMLMALCAERGVAISLLTEHGRFLARIAGFTPGNVLLRREQYRRCDALDASAAIARTIVSAKIANARGVLMRSLRDYPDATGHADIDNAAARLASSVDQVMHSEDLDVIRGVEGEAAKSYFDVFNHLIIAQKEQFIFNNRSRRPPLDRTNALLSFLYAMLAHDARSACEAAGLDPAVGFLHRDRPGRPGLALDLMEEFRPFLADRLALSLINRKQVQADDFTVMESGAVQLSDAARKTVIVTYQKRKQDQILHPFLNEKTTIGLLVHLQARLLSRHLRGDLDAYPPFIWK